MFSRHRFLAGASAVALAAGTTLAGVGVAGAQGSSEIAADLELGVSALTGPVTVTPNETGGPTVAYANKTEVAERCVGFTAPYSTIEENDLDTNVDLSAPGGALAGLALIGAIEGGGGLSMLRADAEGDAEAVVDPNPEVDNDVVLLVAPLLGGGPGQSVLVPAGESVTWTAPTPDEPAVAAVLCIPQVEGGALAIAFGIDKQIIADQINDRLGPLGSVSSGSVSGGSVEMGASLLGSLGGGNDAGDDADTENGAGSGSASSASGGDDTGELPPLEPEA